jgi:hypothetical protein
MVPCAAARYLFSSKWAERPFPIKLPKRDPTSAFICVDECIADDALCPGINRHGMPWDNVQGPVARFDR